MRIVKVVAYTGINHCNEKFTHINIYKRGKPYGGIVSESIFIDNEEDIG
jgi:hypothetical protein